MDSDWLQLLEVLSRPSLERLYLFGEPVWEMVSPETVRELAARLEKPLPPPGLRLTPELRRTLLESWPTHLGQEIPRWLREWVPPGPSTSAESAGD